MTRRAPRGMHDWLDIAGVALFACWRHVRFCVRVRSVTRVCLFCWPSLALQAKLLNHGTVQGFFTTFDVLTLCATTEALPRTARRHKRLCPSNQDRLSTLELHQSTPWRQPPACPLAPHTSFALVRVVARRLLRVRVVARASSPKHTMTKVLSKTTKSSHEYRDSA